MSHPKCVIIGGGAAGFFGAIQCAAALRKEGKNYSVTILEATNRPLTKVKISGGGRCNVTTSCLEPQKLVLNYPRGTKELLGPFSRFGPVQMIAWLKAQGVELKTEPDGRMFPATNSSQTIIDCLRGAADKLGITLEKGQIVKKITKSDESFEIHTSKAIFDADQLLLATGSMPIGHKLCEELGHSITKLVPSLFTFKSTHPIVEGLAGVSMPDVEVEIKFGKKKFMQRGPLLITHWGFSGPAVLKNSAFAAINLYDAGYKGTIQVNWLPGILKNDLSALLEKQKIEHPKKMVYNSNPTVLPKRLWTRIVKISDLEEKTWNSLPNKKLQALAQEILMARYEIDGKGEFKEEFVTCGGVNLKEVNFKNMESKITDGLYFAGEVLNLDGITGGFNFQNAWTTSYLAGNGMAKWCVNEAETQ